MNRTLPGLIACWPLAVGAAEPPAVPSEILAMLKEHRGSWRTEGWFQEGEQRTPSKATWECAAAAGGGGNVCTWHHQWADRPHDSAMEIMGYDPRRNVISITRVMDTGIIRPAAEVAVIGNKMIREWEFSENGKPARGRNEIVVASPGRWEQSLTIDVDGKRVREMRMSHRRVE